MAPKPNSPAGTTQKGGNSVRIKKPLSRKQRRKLERVAKKQRNVLHNLKGKVTKTTWTASSTTHERSVKKSNRKQAISSSSRSELSKQPTRQTLPDFRKRALAISNKREDVEISKLEKLLKIKKRKKLPSSFKDDGLDYILNLTDGTSTGTVWEECESDNDGEQVGGDHYDKGDPSDSEPEEMLVSMATSKSQVTPNDNKHTSPTALQPKTVTFNIPENHSTESGVLSSSYDESSDDVCSDDLSSEDDGSDGYMDTSDGDEQTGEEVRGQDSDVEKYVPPHLREKEGCKEGRDVSKLKKQVQGLINRLSESNMTSVSSQLEQLYRENSRNDMNVALSQVLLKLCDSTARLSDRFAMEHAMLVAILHSHIGQEVGAYVVQAFVKRLNVLLQESPHSTRECSCVLLIISFLYTYRVIHCGLVYDIIRRLLEKLTEKNVELLLALLKYTGMEIRKDDASSLKEIIRLIQQKAVCEQALPSQSPRVRFMLDTISALKTNNARKIPNYDPSLLEHMKKLLRGIVRTTGSLDEGQLKISLQDLLNADTNGRWWIVGSAWNGRATPSQSALVFSSTHIDSESWVLDLARKQRMTTDVRRNVFSVIMTSEDYADAFEKLMKLGLKEVQEREMVHVIVDCCLQESTYNPYYAYLGQKLCEYKHSHQVTFQYSLWDRFKTLESSTRSNRDNLVKLCSHLISSKAVSIAVLRVVEFTELDKVGLRFYKSLITSLLCDYSEETMREVFTRISPLPHLKPLRDKLLIFIKHYLLTQNENDFIVKKFGVVESLFTPEGHLF